MDGQFVVSIGEAVLPAVQFQVTVTLVLFQPAEFAAGDCVGAAVGGAHAGTVTELSWQSPTAPLVKWHAFGPLHELFPTEVTRAPQLPPLPLQEPAPTEVRLKAKHTSPPLQEPGPTEVRSASFAHAP